jgi:hypothetical protein
MKSACCILEVGMLGLVSYDVPGSELNRCLLNPYLTFYSPKGREFEADSFYLGHCTSRVTYWRVGSPHQTIFTPD